jgi:hypothetical protein
MPRIVDYSDVLARMTSEGLRPLYHNSGAFGFPADVKTFARGWIGPTDTTIRPEAREITRSVHSPYESNLGALVTRLWLNAIQGPAWVMPKSHWSYELEFGSKSWLPAMLGEIGIDSGQLIARNNAAALEFPPEESNPFGSLVEALLGNLLGSDFSLVWPRRPIVATVHHHKQIWWITSSVELLENLDETLP